jgi:hypothetical protein
MAGRNSCRRHRGFNLTMTTVGRENDQSMWRTFPPSVRLGLIAVVGVVLGSAFKIMADHSQVIAIELVKLQGLVWCF